MPKKFPDREKKRWLDLYENGKSDMQIAREESVNVRTVRSGIQEARLASQGEAIRQELLSKAIRDHQNVLISLVDKTLLALVMPPSTLDVRCEGSGKMTEIALKGAKAEVRNDGPIAVTVVLKVEVEAETEWGLLQEHLKRDAMWSALSQWKRSLGEMIKARISLRKQAEATLEKRTGYKLVSQPSHPPELYHEHLVPLIFQIALNRIMDVSDSTNLEETLTAHADRGEITRGKVGPVLAKVSEPKALGPCLRNILKVPEDLRTSPEASRARETNRALDELIPKVKGTVKEVRLLNMIPGQCRICRRLGM